MHRKILAAVLALAMLAGFACPALAAGVRTVKDLPQPAGDSFAFLLSGDPQIGASGNRARDIAGWTDSLTNALAQWDDIAFLVAAGDQINTAGNTDELGGFLAPLEILDLVVAPTPGNHDKKAFLDNFDLPNRDGAGNYWYACGDALFVHWNSDSGSKIIGDFLTQRKALLAAKAANPAAKWIIVVFHHSIYSAMSRATDFEVLLRRALFVPLFSRVGVNLVLMGHDHCYVRTKPIRYYFPCGRGTTYLTANSGSGSKYYDLLDKTFRFEAAKGQVKAPTLSRVDVTPQALTVTTCRTDTMEILDSFVVQ